ncbi:only prolin and serin are matching in the corresponding protein [Purpureocillium lilacinum]|uniref:Only prolin and serin are matching in the corresponding protein n=1 Tax=Purpureocillium lilacinum TaxID=33203 RepID=A0A179HRK5_PURLI|nr:only prolin and serin are matching in the corresponding protein [Purpureocillium lilacinum]OAQ92181.1 only prolin and serin are matching in the corresponding protein [Purpureocillium lilacinum]PWI69072.1 hypothetical protein PCL_01457 [Purpureocillium lilacinum]GJN73485.1 hypothetical protein PLICBS_007563 [Purpureocillium lilacinum]GJN83992.1 hypothetical protein PLIIFM63780_007543 [Purpureocillium lilacinum]
MSPRLKPLLLPQLVQERLNNHGDAAYMPYNGLDAIDLSQVYYTTNSSSSDVASPLTPTFSPRGHQRFSSSTSSLELPPMPQDAPSSPSTYTTKPTEKRTLPDVQEDPMERFEETLASSVDHFGLYSCLCDTPCEHRNSSEGLFPGDMVGDDFDFDYDLGFLSDGDVARDYPRKKRSGIESPFAGLTSRLGSRLPTIRRWRSSKRPMVSLRASPTTDLSLENVLSRGPSSRSSSMSAPNQQLGDRVQDSSPMASVVSYYDVGSADNLSRSSVLELTPEEQLNLERDRAMATTPLLPPLLTDALASPHHESPLQSPTVAMTPCASAKPSPPSISSAQFPRPPLSTKPSVTSLRHVPTANDLPLPLPAILQEHDAWSDRLGHANFTISPLPYEVEAVTTETVTKFREDWDTARCNYTKHLVRTGEHYGQTSKIYALTEAKWAETERKWKSIYDEMMTQNSRSAPASASHSRSHSRGRGRGRSSSSVGALGRTPTSDATLGDLEWRRRDECLPSAVPQMLESLDAHGKFPERGDEDIVGPMHRDAVMIRARSEDAKGRFWRNLADKVGFRK